MGTTNYNLNKPSRGTKGYDIQLNANADTIDTELKKAEDHRSGISDKHPAGDITYSGDVAGASDVEQGLNLLKQDLDSTVLGAGDSSAEAGQARPGVLGETNTVLDDRLDKIEKQIGVVVAKSADATLTTDERGVVEVTTALGDKTITLPEAVPTLVLRYTIKKVDNGIGAVIIATTNSQLIDGESSKMLRVKDDAITVISNGTGWIVISESRSNKPERSPDITQNASIFAMGTGVDSNGDPVDISKSIDGNGQLNECRISGVTRKNIATPIMTALSNTDIIDSIDCIKRNGYKLADGTLGGSPIVLEGIFKSNTQYTIRFRGKADTGDAKVYIVYMDDTSDSITSANWDYATITSNPTKSIKHIYFGTGSAIIDAYFDKDTIIIEEGITVGNFITGTKSTFSMRLKGTNKNLSEGVINGTIDSNGNITEDGTTGVISKGYERVQSGEMYTAKIFGNGVSIDADQLLVAYYDINRSFIERVNVSSFLTDEKNFTASHTGYIKQYWYNLKTDNSVVSSDDLQLIQNQFEKGSIATEYIAPVTNNEVYINWGENGVGRSVGDAKDEVCLETKTLTKKISDEKLFLDTDFDLLASLTNVDLIATKTRSNGFLTDAVEFTGDSTGKIRVINANDIPLQEIAESEQDNIANIGKIATSPAGRVNFIVEKGKYTDLASAITGENLTNHAHTYQLAEPITQKLQGLNSLEVYENGTLIIEHAIKEEKIYTDTGIAINDSTLPIDFMESVYKIEYVDSQEIMTPVVLSDITVAGDGLSFTIAGATTGEKYEYVYHYPSELSTIPTIVYSISMNPADVLLGVNALANLNSKEIRELWETLISIAEKELQMYLVDVIDNPYSTTTTEIGLKLNEVINVWK